MLCTSTLFGGFFSFGVEKSGWAKGEHVNTWFECIIINIKNI
jgi:hypothetical protein